LKYILYFYNSLRGHLPNTSYSSSLRAVAIFSNQLSGTLPVSILQLPDLKLFAIQNNSFSGTIDVVFNSSLNYLAVNDNNFHGPLPNVSLCTNLIIFSANNNQFNGTVPDLPSSRYLNLSQIYLQNVAINNDGCLDYIDYI
jgi:hypothetical protein